jgi:6-phosphogluconolactonase (cycloisomerase 2 family)
MATNKRFVAKNGLDNDANSISNLGVKGASLALSGAFATTLTATAATNVTLPITGTLATLAESEALTNKTINKVTITAPANGSTLTIADGKTLTASNTLTFTGTDASNVAFSSGGTVAYTGNKLSVFASTSSSELASVLSDETGTGVVVFGTSPTFTTTIDGGATFGAFASSTDLTVGYTGVAASSTNISTGINPTGVTKTVNIGTGGAVGSTTNVNIGGGNGGLTTVNRDLKVLGNTVLDGNLTVSGNTTTLNSVTLVVYDKNIELAKVTSPTDTTADGAGITVKGATDKTITWDSANNNWTSSENWNLATGKSFKINNVEVFGATSLGANITSSSLTSVGTIGTGTWQGTIIGPTYGGTGINNGANTLTIAGNVSHAGAFTQTFTATANTSVTLPTTGTLATLAGTETLSNKTLTTPIVSGTLTTDRFLLSPYSLIAPRGLIYQGNGALSQIATAIASGTGPRSLAIDPTGRFVYTVNFNSASVSQYSINQNTGALTYVGAVVTGTGPSGLAIDPTGKFLYVTNTGGDTVIQYSINQTNGDLTLGTSFIVGSQPDGICVDPTGRFVYVANYNDASVSQLSINQSTGALTALSPATVASGTQPRCVTVDPTGRYVYVTNGASNSVSQYSINQSTGALTAMATATVSSGLVPHGITADPTGRYVYVANSSANTISQYSINQNTGALTSGSSISSGGNAPYHITADPTGRYVYVANYTSGSVGQFSINQKTGALTQIVSSINAAVNTWGIAVDPIGKFVYAANNNSSSVSQFVISNFSAGVITGGVWQGSAITDTYLGTISATGKVSNSATTATSANTASAIVARDANGNFTAGSITTTGRLQNAGGLKTYSVTTIGQGNVNAIYEIMKVSRDNLNWSNNTPYEITVYSAYYTSGGCTKWLLSYGIGDAGTLTCTYAGGNGQLRVYLGTEVTVSATLQYRPIFVDLPPYMTASIEVRYSTTEVASVGAINASGQVFFSNIMTASGGTGNFFSGSAGTNISGNAATATVLQTARTINGTSFNGSANIDTTEWYHSDRDFPNGTLITTNINYAVTSGDPFVLEIRGNSYGNIIPLDLLYQGYIYSDTIINHGGISNGFNITGLVAINNGGNLCFWFPNQGYWNGYNVKVYTPYVGRATNRVTSITGVVKPTTVKEVALSANIRQSLHSGNYTSYSPSLTGTGASGSWGINVTGSSGSCTGNAATATAFSTGRTNYKGVTDASVSGQMMWKNYGNNHTIFDASAGTSPDGGAVDTSNSAVAWVATYPILMGWNGTSTYGVRVDSARVSDNTSGNAATATTATNQSGGTVSATTGNFSQYVLAGIGTAIAPSSVAGFGGGQVTDSTSGFSAPGIVIGSGTGSHGAIVYGSGNMYFGTENGSASGTMTVRATLTNTGAFALTGTTDSTSTTTGTLTVAGGVGVSKTLMVGDRITIGTTSTSNKFEVAGTSGQLFSVADSMTGTIFSANDVSGIPSIEVLDTGLIKLAQYGGFVAYGISTAQTATGSTQATALAITRPITSITTAASGTGVILPVPQPGTRILIRNGGANTLSVYPNTGGQINSLSTNAAHSLSTSNLIEYVAFSTTQWYTINATYA